MEADAHQVLLMLPSSFDPLGLRLCFSLLVRVARIYACVCVCARVRVHSQIKGQMQRDHFVPSVCPALFMLLGIDNTVSPREASRVFFSAVHAQVPLEGLNESDGEAKPFSCSFIHILCAPLRRSLPSTRCLPAVS